METKQHNAQRYRIHWVLEEVNFGRIPVRSKEVCHVDIAGGGWNVPHHKLSLRGRTHRVLVKHKSRLWELLEWKFLGVFVGFGKVGGKDLFSWIGDIGAVDYGITV